jgi:hypothetical protein
MIPFGEHVETVDVVVAQGASRTSRKPVGGFIARRSRPMLMSYATGVGSDEEPCRLGTRITHVPPSTSYLAMKQCCSRSLEPLLQSDASIGSLMNTA